MINHVSVSNDAVGALVEKSLVRKVGTNTWVPFTKFVLADAIPLFTDVPVFMGQSILDPDQYEELVNKDLMETRLSMLRQELLILQDLPNPADLGDLEKHRNLLMKRKGHCTNLQNMLDCCIDVDGKWALLVRYHRGFGGRGRRYADGPSLQRCDRNTREIASSEFYYDIDLRNAHPSIAAQLPEVVDNHGSYEAILEYGLADPVRRAELLRVVQTCWQCDRSVAKRLFNSLMNTGTVRGWQATSSVLEVPPLQWPTFVTKFSLESRKLIDAMAKRDPGIVELARLTLDSSSKRDPDFYLKSRALGVAMEGKEDEILQVMCATATRHGWQIDSLMFDGGLLRRRPDKTDADVRLLLDAMEVEIHLNTGVRMGLEIKPM